MRFSKGAETVFSLIVFGLLFGIQGKPMHHYEDLKNNEHLTPLPDNTSTKGFWNTIQWWFSQEYDRRVPPYDDTMGHEDRRTWLEVFLDQYVFFKKNSWKRMWDWVVDETNGASKPSSYYYDNLQESSHTNEQPFSFFEDGKQNSRLKRDYHIKGKNQKKKSKNHSSKNKNRKREDLNDIMKPISSPIQYSDLPFENKAINEDVRSWFQVFLDQYVFFKRESWKRFWDWFVEESRTSIFNPFRNQDDGENPREKRDQTAQRNKKVEPVRIHHWPVLFNPKSSESFNIDSFLPDYETENKVAMRSLNDDYELESIKDRGGTQSSFVPSIIVNPELQNPYAYNLTQFSLHNNVKRQTCSEMKKPVCHNYLLSWVPLRHPEYHYDSIILKLVIGLVIIVSILMICGCAILGQVFMSSKDACSLEDGAT